MPNNRPDRQIIAILEPRIRSNGVRKTARAAGLHASKLFAWLGDRERMNDRQIESICEALGLELRAVKPRKAKQ